MLFPVANPVKRLEFLVKNDLLPFRRRVKRAARHAQTRR
jgi:hypothetical protein